MTEPAGGAAADLPLDPDLVAAPPGRRRADPRVLVAIALGAVPGAAARYGLSRLVSSPAGGFPWATFWTNLSGSFVLGFVLVLLVERFPPARYARAFAATGFLGAYTTFSTFSVETDVLVKDGHAAIAVGYVLASLVAGIALAWAGLLTGRLTPRAGRARPESGRDAGAWVAFTIAAAAGAIARYLLDGVIQDATGGDAPWGTTVINVSGSFVLGVVTGLGLYHAFPDDLRFVLGTGFCGAYTTFSTFTYETVRLAEGGAVRAAVRNVVVNTGGGLLAAALGLAVVAW